MKLNFITGLKRCSVCKLDKKSHEFVKNSSSRGDGLNESCRVCDSIRGKVNRQRRKAEGRFVYKPNPALNRNYRLRKKYGLTLADERAILARQGGVCLICESDDPGRMGWCVDHEHKTRIVRGVLCGRCNSVLGMARENLRILANAARYLELFAAGKLPATDYFREQEAAEIARRAAAEFPEDVVAEIVCGGVVTPPTAGSSLDGSKRCSRCGQRKPTSFFSPDRRKTNGLQSQCKPCQREYDRERRRNRPRRASQKSEPTRVATELGRGTMG